MKLRSFLGAGMAGALLVASPSPAAAETDVGVLLPAFGHGESGAGPHATAPPASNSNAVLASSPSAHSTAGDAGCRTSALSSSSPTSWLPLLFAVGVVLVFVRRSA